MKRFIKQWKRTFLEAAKREVSDLFDNRKKVILLLLWPILFAFLVGAIFSAEVVTDLPFVVVDRDQTPFSRTIIRYLNSTRTLRYLGQVESVSEIEKLIHKDEIAFGLLIPRRAITDIKRARSTTLQAYVNASNLMVANLAYSEIMTVSGTISAGVMIKMLRKTGEEKEMAMAHFSPIKNDVYRLYNPAYNYRLYLAPGLWISVFHQLIMLAGALVITRELKSKRLYQFMELWGNDLPRSTAAFTGKLTPYFFIAFFLHLLWYVALLWLTGLPAGRYLLQMEIITIPFIFATLAMGLLISVATSSLFNSIKYVIIISSPAFIISGYTWPLSAMPAPVRWIAELLPLTHYLSAFRKTYQEDISLYFSIHEMAWLLGISMIAFLLAIALFQFKQRRGVYPAER